MRNFLSFLLWTEPADKRSRDEQRIDQLRAQIHHLSNQLQVEQSRHLLKVEQEVSRHSDELDRYHEHFQSVANRIAKAAGR